MGPQIEDVNAWLKLPSGHSDEQLLLRLIAAASSYVETWCSRSFDLMDYVEPRDGNGLTRMTPLVSPVATVTAVVIDGVSIPAATTAIGSGFFMAGKSLHLRGYVFRRGDMNVLLSYSAGYLEPPADIQQAVIELVAMRYRERDRVGLSSVNAAGETTAFITRDMPASVLTLLGQYKQVVPR